MTAKAIAMVAAVGATSASRPRHCTVAAISPTSLMCMSTAKAASAIAYTPKSAGASRRAMARPMANEPTFAAMVPARLHRSPRPACAPIDSVTTSVVVTQPPPALTRPTTATGIGPTAPARCRPAPARSPASTG